MKRSIYLPEGNLCNQNELTMEALQNAAVRGTILSAPVTLCDRELSLSVSLCGKTGIIERGECVYPLFGTAVKDIAVVSRVGKAVCFKVMGFIDGVPVLSRREAQKECVRQYLSRLLPSDVISARITHLESFGAFCDVGCGVPALMPVDRMSVSRISHPKDRFAVGQYINAVVVSNDGGRLSLSHKELLGTWSENASRYEPMQTAAGIVRAVESYGIFVELAPNLSGLAEPGFDTVVGQTAAVHIKSIIPSKMKVKLVIVDSFETLKQSRNYDYPDVSHIDYWRYSPECCDRIIESIF